MRKNKNTYKTSQNNSPFYFKVSHLSKEFLSQGHCSSSHTCAEGRAYSTQSSSPRYSSHSPQCQHRATNHPATYSKGPELFPRAWHKMHSHFFITLNSGVPASPDLSSLLTGRFSDQASLLLASVAILEQYSLQASPESCLPEVSTTSSSHWFTFLVTIFKQFQCL